MDWKEPIPDGVIKNYSESLSFVKKKPSIATVIRNTSGIIITHVCLEQCSSCTIMQFFTENSSLYNCSIIYHIKPSPCLSLLSVSNPIYTNIHFSLVLTSFLELQFDNSVVRMILLTNHCIITLYENQMPTLL